MEYKMYEVYVNGEFVGHKGIYTEHEDIHEEVNTFLHERGFEDYSSLVTEEHYKIQVQDSYQEEVMKDNLEVYLSLK